MAAWTDFRFLRMMAVYGVVDLFSGAERRMRRLPLRPGMTVVDYACGPGRYAIDIARRVGPSGKVHAIDIQPLAISTVRSKARRAGLANIEVHLVDSYQTGLQGSCADLVILLDVFYTIGNRGALLQEVRRLLREGGTFLLEPGNMDHDYARELVAATGMFAFREKRGRDQWYSAV